MRPGTDIFSIDRNSVCKLFMSSEQLGISQSNFETLIKETPFFKNSQTCAFTNCNYSLLHTNYAFPDMTEVYSDPCRTSKAGFFCKNT